MLHKLVKEDLAYFWALKSGKVFLKDSASDGLRTLVHDCHGDSFLEDWVYAAVRGLMLSIEEETIEDARENDHEIVDANVDIYSHDLIEWTKKWRHWIDEAADQGLIEPSIDIIKLAQAGQYCQLQWMLSLILDYYEKRIEEQEND